MENCNLRRRDSNSPVSNVLAEEQRKIVPRYDRRFMVWKICPGLLEGSSLDEERFTDTCEDLLNAAMQFTKLGMKQGVKVNLIRPMERTELLGV